SFSSQLPLPPHLTLFPYTTLFRSRYQAAGRVQNILAWLPGSDPRAAGKAVLIAAHYDGVEAGPAAADDGAGSAAILETLRALREIGRARLNSSHLGISYAVFCLKK